MKGLKDFLAALEGVVNEGRYVPHLQIVPTKFGAIKTVKIDVWLIHDSQRDMVSSVSGNYNLISDAMREDAISELSVRTMKNMMRIHGVQ